MIRFDDFFFSGKNWNGYLCLCKCSSRCNVSVVGYLFCNFALHCVQNYTYRVLCSLLFVKCGTTYIHVYYSDYLDSVDLFHIATMFSYPKLVWRIRLTQDLSVRISLLETIVGIWVWLLCL